MLHLTISISSSNMIRAKHNNSSSNRSNTNCKIHSLLADKIYLQAIISTLILKKRMIFSKKFMKTMILMTNT